jgi:hypothetical protein
MVATSRFILFLYDTSVFDFKKSESFMRVALRVSIFYGHESG